MKQCIGEVLGVDSQYDYYEEEGTVNWYIHCTYTQLQDVVWAQVYSYSNTQATIA